MFRLSEEINLHFPTSSKQQVNASSYYSKYNCTECFTAMINKENAINEIYCCPVQKKNSCTVHIPKNRSAKSWKCSKILNLILPLLEAILVPQCDLSRQRMRPIN